MVEFLCRSDLSDGFFFYNLSVIRTFLNPTAGECGDHVVVVNTKHIAFSGNKWEQKVYSSHTGWVCTDELAAICWYFQWLCLLLLGLMNDSLSSLIFVCFHFPLSYPGSFKQVTAAQLHQKDPTAVSSTDHYMVFPNQKSFYKFR